MVTATLSFTYPKPVEVVTVEAPRKFIEAAMLAVIREYASECEVPAAGVSYSITLENA
jgi:hypothetical protein